MRFRAPILVNSRFVAYTICTSVCPSRKSTRSKTRRSFSEKKTKALVDRLDKQIDRLEDEWDKLNLDPERNKMDLDEIDLIVGELLNKRNRLLRDGQVNEDLPF
jgi:hypothetical protein